MTHEFYHEFKGFGIHPSRIMVKIITEIDDTHLILFEDIAQGTSVTNASEQLASEIVNKMGYNPEDCKFFETYRQYNYDSFDEIVYDWTYKSYEAVWVAKSPKWTLGAEKFRNALLK